MAEGIAARCLARPLGGSGLAKHRAVAGAYRVAADAGPVAGATGTIVVACRPRSLFWGTTSTVDAVIAPTLHGWAGTGRRSVPVALVLIVALVSAACGSSDRASSPVPVEEPPTSAALQTTGSKPDGSTTSQTEPGTILVDFADPATAEAWASVDDPVMGGRSSSAIESTSEGITFVGSLSLDNGGGFTSIRSPLDPGLGEEAAGAQAFILDVTGDGRTYLLQAEVGSGPTSYVQEFTPPANSATTVELPVSGFSPVGRFLDPDPSAPPDLVPGQIDGLSVYLVDGVEGPFALDLRSVTFRP